jgi:hypothetical protein
LISDKYHLRTKPEGEKNEEGGEEEKKKKKKKTTKHPSSAALLSCEACGYLGGVLLGHPGASEMETLDKCH